GDPPPADRRRVIAPGLGDGVGRGASAGAGDCLLAATRRRARAEPSRAPVDAGDCGAGGAVRRLRDLPWVDRAGARAARPRPARVRVDDPRALRGPRRRCGETAPATDPAGRTEKDARAAPGGPAPAAPADPADAAGQAVGRVASSGNARRLDRSLGLRAA